MEMGVVVFFFKIRFGRVIFVNFANFGRIRESWFSRKTPNSQISKLFSTYDKEDTKTPFCMHNASFALQTSVQSKSVTCSKI